MIRNVLQSIGGVGNYGVIAICLFFLTFTGAMVWTFLLRKPFLRSMSQLPLEDETGDRNGKGASSHE